MINNQLETAKYIVVKVEGFEFYLVDSEFDFCIRLLNAKNSTTL